MLKILEQGRNVFTMMKIQVDDLDHYSSTDRLQEGASSMWGGMGPNGCIGVQCSISSLDNPFWTSLTPPVIIIPELPINLTHWHSLYSLYSYIA